MAANTTKKGIKTPSKRTTIASYFQPRVPESNTSPSSEVIARTLESTKRAKAPQQKEKASSDQQSPSQWVVLDSIHHSETKMISFVKNVSHCDSKAPRSHSGSKPKKHRKMSSPHASFQQQRSPLQDGQVCELKVDSPAVGQSSVNEPRSSAKQCQTLMQKRSPYFSSSPDHASGTKVKLAKSLIPNGSSNVSIVRKELSYSPMGEDSKHGTTKCPISRDGSYRLPSKGGSQSPSKDRPRKEVNLGVTLLTSSQSPTKSGGNSGVLRGTPTKLAPPSKTPTPSKSFIPSNLSRPSIDDVRSKGKSTLYGDPKSPGYSYSTPPSSPLFPKSAAVSRNTSPSSPLLSRKNPPLASPLTPGKKSAVVSPNAPPYSPLTPCSPSSLRIKSPVASQTGLSSSTSLPGPTKPALGSHIGPLSSSRCATGPPSPLLLSSKNLSIFSHNSPPSSPLLLVKKPLTIPPLLPSGTTVSHSSPLPSTPKSVSPPTSVSKKPLTIPPLLPSGTTVSHSSPLPSTPKSVSPPTSVSKKPPTIPPLLLSGRVSPTVSHSSPLPSTPKSVSPPTSVSSSPPVTSLHSPNRRSPLSLKKSPSRLQGKGRVTTYSKVQGKASLKYPSSPLHSTEVLSRKTCTLVARSLVKDEPTTTTVCFRKVIKTEDSMQRKKDSRDSEGTSSGAKRRRSSDHHKSRKRKHSITSPAKGIKKERPDYIYCGSPPPPGKKSCVVDLTHSSPKKSSLIDLTLSSDSDGDRKKERKDSSDYLVPRDPDRTPELLLSKLSSPGCNSLGSRKCVSVRRKHLFKFPSPDCSEESRMETTPPLQDNLVTPTLQGAETATTTTGGVVMGAVSAVVKTEEGSGTRCLESGYVSIGSTSSTDDGTTDDGTTDKDVSACGRVGANEDKALSDGKLDDVGTKDCSTSKLDSDQDCSTDKLDSDDAGTQDSNLDAGVQDCSTGEHKVQEGVVDPYSVYLDTEDVFSIEKLPTGIEDGSSDPFDLVQKKKSPTGDPLDLVQEKKLPTGIEDGSSDPLDLVQKPGWRNTPLQEVRVMMGVRKLGYPQVHSSSSVVRLLSSAHESVISNLLDEFDRLSSYRLCSLLEHLTLVTVPSRMPRAEVLSDLWDMLFKLQEAKKPGLLDREVSGLWWGYFRQLLSIHPPGKHELVDQQYAMFIKTLSCRKEPGFCLWEHIETLLMSRSFLGSFIVDLLVADFWAALTFKRSDPPLFQSVFWSSSSATHVTMPIRGLVKGVAQLMQPTRIGSMEETAHLKDLMDLVFLAGTVCSDLTTELLITCRNLPHKNLLCLLSSLHSDSFYQSILNHLPDLKKTHMMYASIFDPVSGTFANSVKPVKLVPTRVPELKKKPPVKPARSSSVSGSSSSGLSSSSSGSCIEGKVKPRSVSVSGPSGKNGIIIKKRKLFPEDGHSNTPKSTHSNGNRPEVAPPAHNSHKNGKSHPSTRKHRNGSWPLRDENQPTHSRESGPSTSTSSHRDQPRHQDSPHMYQPSGVGDRTHSKPPVHPSMRDGIHLPIRPPTHDSPTQRKHSSTLDSPDPRKRPPTLDSPYPRKRPPTHDGGPTERKRSRIHDEINPPTQRKHHYGVHPPIHRGHSPTHDTIHRGYPPTQCHCGHAPTSSRGHPPTRDRIFPSFHDKDRPPAQRFTSLK